MQVSLQELSLVFFQSNTTVCSLEFLL